MSTWALLAPGPSASAATADQLRRFPLGVVGNAFELAPWAKFLASSDAKWWRAHPAALAFAGTKFTMHGGVRGTELVKSGAFSHVTVNSGVLALECAKRAGATRILLLGFDMRGTHFFGPYTNGLGNTTDTKRAMHQSQYARWKRANREIEVINCTPGSALRCFPTVGADNAANLFGPAGEPGRVRAAELHLAPA